jgi:PEGA domain
VSVRIDVRRWGAAVALLGALTVGRVVRAAPALAAAPAKAPDAATKADARQRFDQGVRLFEKGENAAALAEFKRAYDLIPNLLVLYNIGLVYAAMDRPVEAVDALDKVLDGASGATGVSGLTTAQVAKARQVRADQAARIAEVMVVTDKPAVIEVDGVEAGRTPLERPLRFASGAHVLSALAPGCLPARRELTLAGRTNQTLNLVLLPTESSNAHLTLTVPVPGAEVLVNGQRVGTTPLPASVAVAPGTAAIEVRRPGYRVATRTIQVDEGSNGSLRFDLEEDPATHAALKGRLTVTPSEPGAVVSVDGLLRPEALQGLDLPAGPHELRVERAGYLPFERQVEVGAGATTSLVAALVATAETRAASEEGSHVRHVWGASLIAAGIAVAGGSAIYAYATRNDLSSAQSALNAQVNQENSKDSTMTCSLINPDYGIHNCLAIRNYDQNAVDTAKLKRDLAYGGIGLGVVVAGVGTYLFATGRRDLSADTSGTHVGFWSDGQSGGLIFSGGF